MQQLETFMRTAFDCVLYKCYHDEYCEPDLFRKLMFYSIPVTKLDHADFDEYLDASLQKIFESLHKKQLRKVIVIVFERFTNTNVFQLYFDFSDFDHNYFKNLDFDDHIKNFTKSIARLQAGLQLIQQRRSLELWSFLIKFKEARCANHVTSEEMSALNESLETDSREIQRPKIIPIKSIRKYRKVIFQTFLKVYKF